eukprot:TRINITY_DN3325_c0_g1_i1.p1 TRINITY_DN3325_c0_g1~~TRINITY_DN3325_c0_g1_i1.p1  ORF type:complete len:453 (+),score=142.92 TRINITY_DN3325_c0_g1_i1:248-1606(+)
MPVERNTLNITITTLFSDNVYFYQMESTETIENLKALLEVETGIKIDEQQIMYNGKEMETHKTLGDYNIPSEAVLVLQQKKKRQLITLPNLENIRINNPPQRNFQPQQQQQNPQAIMNQILSDINLQRRLSTANPVLLEAAMSGNLQRFTQVYNEQEKQRQLDKEKREKELKQLEEDPFNIENQGKIEEMIRQENVLENMEHAMEHNPESFAKVVMLYVDCEVNGIPMKAFVDSGAQMTIMSESCARKCNLLRLIDKRFAGMAQGVGTAKILGKVHTAQMKIGNSFFVSSFTILQNQEGAQDIEFLLGLDMLKKFQCQIDLKDNVLHIGSEKAPFLSEKDIPNSHSENEISLRDSSGGLSIKPSNPTNNNNSTNQQPSSSQQNNFPIGNLPLPNSNLQQQQTNNRPQQSRYREDVVLKLIELSGRTREEVIEALNISNGNPDIAIQHLSFDF